MGLVRKPTNCLFVFLFQAVAPPKTVPNSRDRIILNLLEAVAINTSFHFDTALRATLRRAISDHKGSKLPINLYKSSISSKDPRDVSFKFTT